MEDDVDSRKFTHGCKLITDFMYILFSIQIFNQGLSKSQTILTFPNFINLSPAHKLILINKPIGIKQSS